MKKTKTILVIAAVLAICSNAHAQSLRIRNHTNFTIEFNMYATDGMGCQDYQTYYADIYATSGYNWTDPCEFVVGSMSGPAQTWYLTPTPSYVSSCPTLPSGFNWSGIYFVYIDGCMTGFGGTLWDGTYGCTTSATYGGCSIPASYATWTSSGGNVTVDFY